ncbi:hypothetical protein [Anaerospora hongkongensis]|uniref:hypothetical protein n=1 Tax=Anaerospora hongkongensis TaxID=244830 RepID=UPI002FD9F3B3
MDKVLNKRCCMCPQQDWTSRICPGKPGSLQPETTTCQFVKCYRDNSGKIYFARAGIGGDAFKIFYQKPGKNPHGWRPALWRSSFDEAQGDLNQEALRYGWQTI